ncbi:hypothetical protein [Methylobacterium longum]|uniref:hypothetical protein n=1 Tax=Methylobacterium longum TaxID=767694 RepID=UPI0025B2A19C|nr:hypothetical protein [Methylobacterium longum]
MMMTHILGAATRLSDSHVAEAELHGDWACHARVGLGRDDVDCRACGAATGGGAAGFSEVALAKTGLLKIISNPAITADPAFLVHSFMALMAGRSFRRAALLKI